MLKVKILTGLVSFCLTLGFFSPFTVADSGPEYVAELLYDRGYYDILFTDTDPPNYRVNACKRGIYYRLKVRPNGEIVRRTKRGTCKVAGLRDRREDGVHVRAPFVDVRTGKDGVRVRAPFVDIRVK